MLQGKEHHLKSQEVPIVAGFCHFGSRLLLGYIQVGSFMDTASEDMLMDLLGLGAPSQQEGGQDHLTSTVSCQQWRRRTSSHFVSFSGSFWTQLNATGSARTQYGPMARAREAQHQWQPQPWVLGQGQDEAQ